MAVVPSTVAALRVSAPQKNDRRKRHTDSQAGAAAGGGVLGSAVSNTSHRSVIRHLDLGRLYHEGAAIGLRQTLGARVSASTSAT